jgi:hypothetical protein
MKRYYVIILLTSLSACGGAGGLGALGGSPHSVDVQLNDTWNQAFPSESYAVNGASSMFFPDQVQVVGGTFAGNPGQYLHARLHYGSQVCTYQATSTAAAFLTIFDCTSTTEYHQPAGISLELENYDAPGLLLEAHITIDES